MRPAPRYRPDRIDIAGYLEPSGAHTLEIEVPGGMVRLVLGHDHVNQLERAIEQWKRATTVADGRSDTEIHNRRPIPLEIR